MPEMPGERLLSSDRLRELASYGIEIGALHHPLPVPPEARVRYVDRMPVSELRRQYPELAGHSDQVSH